MVFFFSSLVFSICSFNYLLEEPMDYTPTGIDAKILT